MGRMKDKFTEEQERLVNEAVEAFIDDDYQYQEYLNAFQALTFQPNHVIVYT